eukprot:gene34445-46217_t
MFMLFQFAVLPSGNLNHPTVILTGTFTLDLERLTLIGLLQEKLGWASLLAVQKAVTFRVQDNTLATEFGPGSAVGSVESAGRNCGSIQYLPRPQSGASSTRRGSERVHVSASGSTFSQSHTSERPPDLPSIQYGNYSAMDLRSDSDIQDDIEY